MQLLCNWFLTNNEPKGVSSKTQKKYDTSPGQRNRYATQMNQTKRTIQQLNEWTTQLAPLIELRWTTNVACSFGPSSRHACLFHEQLIVSAQMRHRQTYQPTLSLCVYVYVCNAAQTSTQKTFQKSSAYIRLLHTFQFPLHLRLPFHACACDCVWLAPSSSRWFQPICTQLFTHTAAAIPIQTYTPFYVCVFKHTHSFIKIEVFSLQRSQHSAFTLQQIIQHMHNIDIICVYV